MSIPPSALAIAERVRRVAEEEAVLRKFPATLQYLCADASFALEHELVAACVPATFVLGIYVRPRPLRWTRHCWVAVGSDTLIDITATQFGVRAEVLVAPAIKSRTHLRTRSGSAAKQIVATTWPPHLTDWVRGGYPLASRQGHSP